MSPLNKRALLFALSKAVCKRRGWLQNVQIITDNTEKLSKTPFTVKSKVFDGDN
jgi:hypothetical protein